MSRTPRAEPPGPDPHGHDPHSHDAHSQDPDPATTPGLDRGVSVPVGDTPPAEGSLSESGPEETHNPTRGWATAPLLALVVLTAAVAGFFVTYAVLLAL
ncbi:DUF6480 family protein [Streptomyces sp. 4N509B]|uniref:DUF6480 family protein n=1 Tax=Streptomyces sp. 4N509B TaxID=3457413 RepID=UPI003FCF5C17